MMIMTKTKFYKKNSILLVLILFLLTFVFPSELALAQEVNLCLDGTPTFNILAQRNINSWYQTASNIKDNDIGTMVGFAGYAQFEDQAYGKYEAIVDFAQLATIVNKVSYDRYWYFYGQGWGEPSYSGYEKTYLYYGGAWHLIHTHNFNGKGVGAKTDAGLIEITTGGPWTDVSKCKIEAYMIVNAGGNEAGTIRHYTYELRAFGLVYEDIGLRIFDGTQTVSIAVEPLGTLTSPLRIAKNGVIYGIPLVDVGDPNESGIRINTSSGIKALRKYP
jgi:hypothetical protein